MSNDSWLIPFNYDDNEKYLMRFFYNTDAESGESPDQCEFYEYKNGNLLLADFGTNAFTKPIYTSNSAPKDDISDKLSFCWHSVVIYTSSLHRRLYLY